MHSCILRRGPLVLPPELGGPRLRQSLVFLPPSRSRKPSKWSSYPPRQLRSWARPARAAGCTPRRTCAAHAGLLPPQTRALRRLPPGPPQTSQPISLPWQQAGQLLLARMSATWYAAAAATVLMRSRGLTKPVTLGTHSLALAPGTRPAAAGLALAWSQSRSAP